MTTSVADKTPTPAKVWRRHNDPPGLWFGVALGSASLHLLAFWLIRTSDAVGLWFPQENQTAVSIELIDVPPQSNSTDKPATLQPQQSAPTTTTAPPTSTNQDAEIINPDEQSQPENNSNIAQSPPEVVPQAESTPTPTATTQPEPTPTVTTEPEPAPTPEPTPTVTTEPAPTPTPEPTPIVTTEPEPTPTPTPTVPVSELPWKRREEIELGQGQQLPSDIPPVTPEQVQEAPAVEEQTPRGNEDTPATSNGETANAPSEDNSSNPNGETANSPSGDNSSNSNGETTNTPSADNSPSPSTDTAKTPTERYTPSPTEEPANTPTENNSSNSTARGAMSSDKPLSVYALLSPVAEAEARRLANDLPEVLVQYTGSSEKTVDSSYLPGDFTIQPAQLLASLVIDKDGNFQQAIVLTIEPSSLQAQKGVYEQLVTDLFRNEKFTAAHNRDGTKPDFSNFFVRITIQPTSQ
ncbi:MAG TPA: hypothetical protein V6D25_05610 [Leptolyngbyaceae cyanobacterium]